MYWTVEGGATFRNVQRMENLELWNNLDQAEMMMLHKHRPKHPSPAALMLAKEQCYPKENTKSATAIHTQAHPKVKMVKLATDNPRTSPPQGQDGEVSNGQSTHKPTPSNRGPSPDL